MIHCAFAGRADRRWNHYEEGTESPLLQVKLFLNCRVLCRVSVQGVESLWGDCRFIPADWGS